MSTDEKVLQILEDLEKGQKALEAGQKALQDDMTAVKAETGKIPAIEQRLEHHNKLLAGLTANMTTVLEEQHAQRSDIRSLHTEVHESREELKGEIREARDEAKRDTIDLKATVVKRFQSDERRITNIEEHEVLKILRNTNRFLLGDKLPQHQLWVKSNKRVKSSTKPALFSPLSVIIPEQKFCL